MSYNSVILTVILLLLGRSSAFFSGSHNWTSYSVECDSLPLVEHKLFLVGIPFSEYWDASRHFFLKGVLPNHLSDGHQYDAMKATIIKKIPLRHSSGVALRVQTTTIDKAFLYMSHLGALQHVLITSDTIQNILNSERGNVDNFSILQKFANRLVAREDLQFKRQILVKKTYFSSLELDGANERLSTIHKGNSFAVENWTLLVANKSASLIAGIEEHYRELDSRLITIYASIVKVLQRNFEKEEQAALADQTLQTLNIQTKYKVRNEMEEQGKKFRAHIYEQIRLQKALREVNIIANTSLYFHNIQAAVWKSAVAEEVASLLLFFTSGLHLKYIFFAIAMSLVTWIAILEASSFAMYIAKLLLGRISFESGALGGRSSASAVPESNSGSKLAISEGNQKIVVLQRPDTFLILRSETWRRVKEMAQSLSLLVSSSSPSLLLPNALFVGPGGCGKTCVSNEMARISGVNTLSISGGYLMSVGLSAGHVLSSTFRQISQSAVPTIVIIDEADDILRITKALGNREGNSDVSQGNTTSCQKSLSILSAILDAIRNNSPYLSICFTSRLKLTEINPALLDRIDTVYSMNYPSTAMRLEYLLDKFNQSLSSYLPKDNVSHALPLQQYNVHHSFELLSHWGSLSGDLKMSSALSDGESEGEAPRPREVNTLTAGIRTSLKEMKYPSHSFDIDLCFNAILVLSERWSFRDLNKFLENVRTDVLGTERYALIQLSYFQLLKGYLKSDSSC